MRSPLLVTGIVLFTVLVLVAVFAPWLAPYDPRALSGAALQSPSARHLLGTNELGQDILSRIFWGARTTLVLAVAAAGLTLLVGGLLGVASGLLGGAVDMLTMRTVDVFLALPVLPLLVLVAALVGPSRVNLILVIGLIIWPVAARVVRSQTLTLRTRGFVAAARGFGGGPWYLIRRHLAPALGPILIAGFVNVAAQAVLLEAGLAFLGLADPTQVSWGLMLNRALLHQGVYFTPLWTWWVLPAGFAITMAVLAFTFLGVGLEPVFNPRVRRTP